MTLRIEHLRTTDLTPSMTRHLIQLCDAAYGKPMESYFRDIGPGEHLMGWEADTPVTHLMWVPRELVVAGRPPMQSAYIELVATAPAHQRRGHAGRLLAALPPLLASYDIAALSPVTERFYRRYGWLTWQGPLSHRHDGHLVLDPEEQVMVLRLPRTPADLNPGASLSVNWRAGEVW